MNALVIEPGQVWIGVQEAHPWTVRIKRLSLSAVEFDVLARGARGKSRVRGRFESQWMNRRKFLAQHRLLRDTKTAS